MQGKSKGVERRLEEGKSVGETNRTEEEIFNKREESFFIGKKWKRRESNGLWEKMRMKKMRLFVSFVFFSGSEESRGCGLVGVGMEKWREILWRDCQVEIGRYPLLTYQHGASAWKRSGASCHRKRRIFGGECREDFKQVPRWVVSEERSYGSKYYLNS